MNRTTTVVVALIAAAGLSTMAYTVPEQRALAWGGFGGCGDFGGCGGFGGCGFGWGGCGGGFFGGCGFGCGGGFFVHKTIIQTVHQVNNCTGGAGGEQWLQGGNEDHNQNQKDKQTICLNTAVNNAGRGLGANGVGSGNLQSDVPDNLL
jgi:hypothetical protein